ncbi:MAG: hypothetical protein EA383_09895 [Spirochaetaceae bacterium]|nr:MAG: hypothetical protein EA383_09895 [Spirochaetaceae bacterium]
MLTFSPYIDPKRRKSSDRTLILLAAVVIVVGLITGSRFALVMGGLSMAFALYTVLKMRNFVQKTALTITDDELTAHPPLVPDPYSIRYKSIQRLHMDRKERLLITSDDGAQVTLGLHLLSTDDRKTARKEIARLAKTKIVRVTT